MTVVALHPDRVEVFSGTIQGRKSPTWFVERIEPGHSVGTIVSEQTTQTAAMSDAALWGLPIVRRH